MCKLKNPARFVIIINIVLSLVFQPLLFLPELQAIEPNNKPKLGMIMDTANSDWGYDANHPGNAANPSDPINIASIRAGTVKRAKDDLRIELWERYEQWGQIETSPGVYDFDRSSTPYALSTDYAAQLASENNMGLSLRILTPFGRSESAGILPPDITFSSFNEATFKARYKDFVLALMNRYETKGKPGIIKYLWIGVEVDQYFYKLYNDSRQISDVATSKQVLQNKIGDFATFVNYIKTEVKAIYPNVKIGTITTYHNSSKWSEADASGSFNGLNDIVIPVHQVSDVIGYTYYHKLDDPPGSMKTGGSPAEAIQALKNLLGFTVTNFPGKKAYLTETGWNTIKSYDPQKGEEEQKLYIEALFSLLRNYPDYIEAMAYRGMTDVPAEDAQNEARNIGISEELVVDWAALYLQSFGLRKEDGLPKPAYATWMTHAPRLERQTTSERWQLIKNNAKFTVHDSSFKTPQNVGLPINTSGWEDSANISADGKTLLLTYVPYDHVSAKALGYPTISGPPSGFGKNDLNCHIYISNKGQDGKWSSPQLLNTSIQTNSEGGPQMSYDNQKIFFQRENPNTKSDFWVSKYDNASSKWLAASKMSGPPNSAEAEGDIAMSKNEDEMIFERSVNGQDDLFVSKKDNNGIWQTPQNLGAPVNTTAHEFQPFLSWDGKELYFTSNRNGNGAIYRSIRADENSPWQTPEIVIEGGTNVYAVGEATLTRNGKYLYFIAAYESKPLPLQSDFVEYDTDVMYVQRNNRTPIITKIGNKSTSEKSSLSFDVNATDADGDLLSYSVANLPSGATFAGNTFTWTPNYNQAGRYNVTFKVSDRKLTDEATITIIVKNTDVTPPTTFSLASLNKKLFRYNSTLRWSASSDFESGLNHYELYIDNTLSINFNANTLSAKVPTNLRNGLHSYYVVAIDNAGNRTTTNSQIFQIDKYKPKTYARNTNARRISRKKAPRYLKLYRHYRDKYKRTHNHTLRKRYYNATKKYHRLYNDAKKSIATAKLRWYVKDPYTGNRAYVTLKIQKRVKSRSRVKRKARYLRIYRRYRAKYLAYKNKYRKTRNRTLRRRYQRAATRYKKAMRKYLRAYRRIKTVVYKTVKVPNYRWTSINKWRTYTYRTRSRGVYRYLVYAKDKAGNKQQNIARSFLIVR